MAASIAHEVDQPLSGVVINANACLRFLSGTPPNVDEVRDGLPAIARDGRRASDVIARIRGIVAIVDPTARSTVYVNAGHPAGVLWNPARLAAVAAAVAVRSVRRSRPFATTTLSITVGPNRYFWLETVFCGPPHQRRIRPCPGCILCGQSGIPTSIGRQEAPSNA